MRATVRIKPLGWIVLFCCLGGAVLALLGISRVTLGGVGSAVSAALPEAAFAPTATFGHTSATDPVLQVAHAADDIDSLKALRDQTVTVHGRVLRVVAPAANDVRVLEFSRNEGGAIRAVLAASDFAAFPDPKTLVGQQVLITGSITLTGGRQLQVRLTTPEQLRIVNQAG